jgi:DNA-binding IclR family transcriptional regulator
MKEYSEDDRSGLLGNSSISIPEELKILALIESGPKFIEEIASASKIPPQECRDKVDLLVDLGLVAVEHDSDLYGHELLKIRRAARLLVVP